MMAARVKLSSPGMGKMLTEGWIYDALRPHAESTLAKAQASAPVASGAYRGSLHIEEDTTDRNVLRVVADVPYAMIVEANTGNLAQSL